MDTHDGWEREEGLNLLLAGSSLRPVPIRTVTVAGRQGGFCPGSPARAAVFPYTIPSYRRGRTRRVT